VCNGKRINCVVQRLHCIACKYELIVYGVNKSNYPIQNPLLLVTEPRTRICGKVLARQVGSWVGGQTDGDG
jgi:hypothetical protein